MPKVHKVKIYGNTVSVQFSIDPDLKTPVITAFWKREGSYDGFQIFLRPAPTKNLFRLIRENLRFYLAQYQERITLCQ